jgi:uncharacterized protein DUF4328
MNAAAQLAWSRGLARAVSVLLAATAILVMLTAGRSLAEIDLAERAEQGSATVEEIDRFNRELELWNGFAIALAVGTGVVWLFWEYRAYRNLQRMGVQGLMSPWAAVGWWFVPLANLVMAFRGVRDLWKASGPPPSPSWSLVPTWSVLGWWWGTLLASRVVSNAGFSIRGEADDAAAIAQGDRIVIAGDLIVVIAAVLAILIVRAIVQRQDALSVAVEIPPRPDA